MVSAPMDIFLLLSSFTDCINILYKTFQDQQCLFASKFKDIVDSGQKQIHVIIVHKVTNETLYLLCSICSEIDSPQTQFIFPVTGLYY